MVSGDSSLTFTTGNWANAQTVTLAATSDADSVNGRATIRLSGGGLTAVEVTVDERDDDPAATLRVVKIRVEGVADSVWHMDNSGDVSMPDVVDSDGNAVFAPYSA